MNDTQRDHAARTCERFSPGPVSVHRMDLAYRESQRIASLLQNGNKSEALRTSRVAFQAALVSARTRRKTRNDFAFVTRLRWAGQWIEMGLLLGGDSASFREALAMIDEAKKVFMGQTSPDCAPPETELPAVVHNVDRGPGGGR